MLFFLDSIQQSSNVSKVMLNVDSNLFITDETTRPVNGNDKKDTSPLSSPASEIKLITNGSSKQLNDKEEELKHDSSDEEETNVYSIQMGRPISVASPRISDATNQNIPKDVISGVNTQKLSETYEIVENIKNENKEVIEKVTIEQQVETPIKNNNVENEVTPQSPIEPIKNKNLDTAKMPAVDDQTSRAASPLWTYTLPAPPKFADNDSIDTQTMNGIASDTTEYYNRINDTQTIILDSSKVSDTPIKPIINERLPLDFNAFTTDASTIGDAESIMTSDIEDGYQGYSQKFSREALLESLERRRDQFIENEFEFLTKIEGIDIQDTTTTEKSLQPAAVIQQKNPSRQTSTESSKSNVINELNDVLINNKLDTVIKSKNVDTHIPAINGNGLSNFSIQNYSNENATKINSTASIDVPDDSTYTIKRRSFSTHNGEEATDTSSAAVFVKPKEFVPAKRTSLTTINGNMFKSPNRINRSDSFHSTRTENGPEIINGLTPRSSSYISLIGTQKFENRSLKTNFFDSNRRKSSSELSIADSPSLQSLVVMKSILSNSRKNSLNYENNSEQILLPKRNSVSEIRQNTDDIPLTDQYNGEMTRRVSIVTNGGTIEKISTDPIIELRKISVTEVKRSENNSIKAEPTVIAPQPTNNDQQNITITQVNKASEDTPNKKTWKYQGPPAINLSTWVERPKSMISIKTDNDYKFGGAGSVVANAQRKFGNNNNNVDTIELTNKNFKTNIVTVPTSIAVSTVKPIETTTSEVDNDHLPIVRGVVKKNVSPLMDSVTIAECSPENITNLEIRRSSYEISTFITEKPKQDTPSTPPAIIPAARTSISLGRVPIPNKFVQKNIPSQTFTMQRGTSFTSPINNGNQPLSLATKVSTGAGLKGFKVSDPVSPKSIYVPSKDSSFDSGYKSMPPVYSEQKLSIPKVAAAATTDKESVPFSQFTLRKTGLKDKILADLDTRNVVNTPPKITQQVATIQLRQQDQPSQTYRRTTSMPISTSTNFQKITNHATASIVPPSNTAFIPPPPAPPLKLLPASKRKILPPPDVDPHDQLLASIRNFTKTSLKKK